MTDVNATTPEDTNEDPLAFLDTDSNPAESTPSGEPTPDAALQTGTTSVPVTPVEPAAPAKVEAPAPAATPAATTEAPEGYVPVAALQAERQKRQEAEARLNGGEPAPNDFVPPQPGTPEHALYVQEQANLAILNERLENSERFARLKHDDAKVTEVQQWALQRFETDPEWARKVLTARDPYQLAIEEYDRDQAFSGVTPEDMAAFKAWKAGQPAPAAAAVPAPTPAAVSPSAFKAAQAQTSAVAAPAAAPAKAAPPKTLADETAADGPMEGAVGDGLAFEEAFS